MFQLSYISTAARGTTGSDIDEILRVSRRNNRRDGLTGLLVHDGKRFLQVLEGMRPAVEEAFARIKADPRHRAAVQLSARDVDGRQFGDWEMACQEVSTVEDRHLLGEVVDEMVARVPDANLRALFSGFARIDRAA